MFRSLDGGWQLREALGDTWQWYVHKLIDRRNSVTKAADADAWLPAHVPGAVLDDLVRAGEVAEPRHGRRSREAEWVADRHWVYRRHVDLPPLEHDDSVWIEFDGIDPGGRVFWDGHEVGAIDGLHRRLRLRVGGADRRELATGGHTLTVVVLPALDTEPQVGRTDRVRALAPRVGSGWDFAPRMRHQGIWRPVRLIIGHVGLASVRARTEVELDGRTGTVIVDAVIDGRIGVGAAGVITIELSRDERTVASGSAPVTDGAVHVRLPVHDVQLWWPAGLGEHALYDLRVAIGDDERMLRVGFRNARLVANAGAPPNALGYTAEVNGRTLPLVGWNWAPADLLFGVVTATRIARLLDLVADSGARILRVWGGGLIESDDFYDACDQRGILVWQELAQSSSGIASAPATDADFIAQAVEETVIAAARLSRHPSLFLWCGGNELEDDAGPLDESRSPVLAAMRSALADVDPGRPWLPTSPSGPTFHHRMDRIAAAPDDQHDVHGPWEHQGLVDQHTLADAGTSLAHTEFGVEGMASLRSLRAVVPEGQRWPADLSNPVYRHLGQWWNNATLVSESFGGRLGDLRRMQRASQWLQATGLQYAIEADRRRWPRCSMVLPWQLAESFPNAWCTSVVEWSGEAKPAFHAARRAFARTRASIRTPRSAWGGQRTLTAQAWLWAEDGVPAGTSLHLLLRDVAGAIVAETTCSDIDAIAEPVAVATLETPLPEADGIVVWEAQWRAADGTPIDTERVVAVLGDDLGALLDAAPTQLDVRVHEDGDLWRIIAIHVGGPTLIGPVIHDARPWGAAGSVIVRDDPRPMMPGETRELTARWSRVEPVARALVLDAWNFTPLTMHATGTRTRNRTPGS
ncbi:glycosyl hydrolase 2 galactose-binding domain-containing protein [Microbacterium terrisoli]|uniref:glycosyl hydrolase 2 galactose-binding domain-containing protein n=1 Tax=Microbacterium terrisoli TaxID=3242192 RepID=UPI00280428C0|nr:hypothetical protein [Microbacterium protaetiae]